MRCALLLLWSLVAAGCLGSGGEEGPGGPVPVTGRWRQLFPAGESPPFEGFKRMEFHDDGTFTDLTNFIDGTYVIDRGQLTTTIENPSSGTAIHASAYARVDRRLLRVALRPERTDDGWVGTWRGDELRSDPFNSNETSWVLELRADSSARLAWNNGFEDVGFEGGWELDEVGGWVTFESSDVRMSWATLADRALGRLAYEQF